MSIRSIWATHPTISSTGVSSTASPWKLRSHSKTMSTFRYATRHFFSTGQFLEPEQQRCLAAAVLFGQRLVGIDGGGKARHLWPQYLKRSLACFGDHAVPVPVQESHYLAIDCRSLALHRPGGPDGRADHPDYHPDQQFPGLLAGKRGGPCGKGMADGDGGAGGRSGAVRRRRDPGGQLVAGQPGIVYR